MSRLVLWVSYDISSDKRRRKIERCLQSYGERLQYSLFEIVVSQHKWPALRKRLVTHIDPQTDALNYYPICLWCQQRILTQGTAELPEQKGFRCIC